MNQKLKGQIEYAMFKNKISKKQLASYMNMSYPTMLSKIESADTLKISEAVRLCRILDIELSELLTIK